MGVENNYIDLPLEEVMGDRFGRYSKYIIQERALPDVRDGLKPVQRRILFAMHEDGNTQDNNFRKAAKTVGTVIGNYHPHGDISVYDAMVRLSQDWKMRNELVEMHGNNGSIDGDPAAAMRYTEARLSSISSELMRDLQKETVDFIPNFDDTIQEPTVFPAKFPNLLVNGSTGISAGYATEIPPHHLGEVIDAVIMKMENQAATVDDLLSVIKGPDFPTGGIVQGKEGIKKAYETGRGRIIIRGRAAIEKMRGNRKKIVIDELPYDVNKANLVRKIDELSVARKVEGITEVRDETDRTGLRIVIELRKDADSEGVLNYLYKNTNLQISYNFNMVAIQDQTPKLLSLPAILDAYIAHQKEVVIRQTTFDLTNAEKRAHIVEGLIKAISILDELIQTIRLSKNKQDAKNRIIEKYEFTDEQAEAIVMLQLYRLTNTDIQELEEEAAELRKKITSYQTILNSEQKLLEVIKKDLIQLKDKYVDERRTRIEEEIEEININIEVVVASEDVLVSITNEGYIKRTSLRSYTASNGEDFAIKDEDHVVTLAEINTTDHLLIFTSKGRYVNIPVHELPDIRWKDIGQHLSNLTAIDPDERVVQCIPMRSFSEEESLVFFTKKGMVKRSHIKHYQSNRYARPLIALNLKDDDEVVNVTKSDGKGNIFVVSNTGYGLWFAEESVSEVGQRAQGVISMRLKDGEFVVNGYVFDHEHEQSLFIVTHRGACKRMLFNELEKTSRANRGIMVLRELKGKPHQIRGVFLTKKNESVEMLTDDGQKHTTKPEDYPPSGRLSNGSFVIEEEQHGEVTAAWKIARYETPFKEDE